MPHDAGDPARMTSRSSAESQVTPPRPAAIALSRVVALRKQSNCDGVHRVVRFQCPSVGPLDILPRLVRSSRGIAPNELGAGSGAWRDPQNVWRTAGTRSFRDNWGAPVPQHRTADHAGPALHGVAPYVTGSEFRGALTRAPRALHPAAVGLEGRDGKGALGCTLTDRADRAGGAQ